MISSKWHETDVKREAEFEKRVFFELLVRADNPGLSMAVQLGPFKNVNLISETTCAKKYFLIPPRAIVNAI